jgi:methionyl-tRNA formyltransferase
MRVIFLGTPEFAVPALRALRESSYEVSAIFTQPDRPAGRGQKPVASAVKKFGLSAGIPVFQPEKIRAIENRPLLESFQPDFIVVVAFGQILPAWMLQLPLHGCVNVHGSLLPRYRGAAPVAWTLLNGDTVTGITTMLMDEHLDTGPMLLQREVEIPGAMTAGELAASLAELGAELLIPSLNGLQSGVVKPVPQDHTLASYAPRITKEMAAIRWNRDARDIHNQIRGLNPWPLAHSGCRDLRLQILKSIPPDPSLQVQESPGMFLGATERGIRIACGAGTVLEIIEVQPAGKKRITGREFANGQRLKAGERLFPA